MGFGVAAAPGPVPGGRRRSEGCRHRHHRV